MGKIITFYSYKGGTGRTMALANIAYLLASWEYKVLAVDWDLEAPGLEFFYKEILDINRVTKSQGIIDILKEIKSVNKTSAPTKPKWRKYITKIPVKGTTLDLITAGKRDDASKYFHSVRNLDVSSFYSDFNGGKSLELLRDDWKSNYDFVLIDSRTGVTDIGGICTIQMPDILILLFTATEQSINGVADISKRADIAQKNFPADRFRLLSLPIASRFDSTEEFKLSKKWLEIFTKKIKHVYSNWLPASIEPTLMLEITKIPYSAYFSFGEKLPVVEQSRKDAGGLTFAYENIASLIAHELEFAEQLLNNRDQYINEVAQSKAERLKQKIEKELKVKIPEINKIDQYSIGFTKNTDGEVTGLALNNCNIDTLQHIIQPLTELTKLTELSLTNNRLDSLDLLKDFRNITKLDLSNNQIKRLPIWVTDFKTNIVWEANYTKNAINLYQNPLQIPPPEIIRIGKEAIKSYFLQQDALKVNYLFEAKMLIVGEPGAGKTSLVRKIKDPNCVLANAEDVTRGIDVKTYYFPLSKEDVSLLTENQKNEEVIFRLNLWDFGGQEIYKNSHRFFLSKRSLYVLVADSRNEDTDFNYWLHIVEMYGGDSSLIIVLNEKYGRKKALDIPAMRARFSNIKEVISVDLAEDDKKRFNQLTQAIRYHVSRLPHIGSPVPAKWAVVREALEKDNYNTITLQNYLNICAKNGIEKIDDALVLSQYFHDIGVFLHFQNDVLLKNTIFLNSTWATQAVYQILDDPLLNEQNGRFSRADAEKIWSADEFALLQEELLQLMKKFFLTYEIGNTGEYIVPERLPPTQPKYEWDDKNNLIVQYKYDFFMPKGILSQFIVQMNNYIENHDWVWKRGVVLERETTAAEVTESYDARNIKIRVAGKNRRDFMTIITEKIDELNAQYEKMAVKKLIPCNCSECKASAEPYFYEYADLKRRIENNRREVECERSYEMVTVRGLIDDVINEDLSKRKEKPGMAKREKIFISYSHQDQEWLEKVQMNLKALSHLDIAFDLWDDTRIESGDLWREEIETALSQTDIAILLISTPFLASDFIRNDELPQLLKSAEEGGTKILPFIISPSIFAKTELSKFQAVNNPSKPLSSLSESEQEQTLVKLIMQVMELMGS